MFVNQEINWKFLHQIFLIELYLHHKRNQSCTTTMLY